jgi:phosphoglycerate dehydrogenase-like enzyme
MSRVPVTTDYLVPGDEVAAVLLRSHLAGQTVEARLRAGLSAATDVIAVLDGREPRHPVN